MANRISRRASKVAHRVQRDGQATRRNAFEDPELSEYQDADELPTGVPEVSILGRSGSASRTSLQQLLSESKKELAIRERRARQRRA